ncbi:MAG: Hpt domain-containing protein [Planctomycetota bacterium]|jgi:HPt (histidine-containing phosphotransfer) domain-containing protein
MAQPNPDSPGGPLDPARGGEDEFPTPTELTQYFLEQFQQKVFGLEEAWEGRDLEAVRRIAHELRGDATACDLGEVCGEAWQLETGLAEDARLSEVRERIEDLITLCRQTSGRHSRGI